MADAHAVVSGRRDAQSAPLRLGPDGGDHRRAHGAEFVTGRYRGARWFSWFTGIPLLWLVFPLGITGYWLVWDQLAQYVAIASSELLDVLPIFGDPMARNFPHQREA